MYHTPIITDLRNPKPKMFWVIHFVRPIRRIENFAEFDGKIIFSNPTKNGGVIARKHGTRTYPVIYANTGKYRNSSHIQRTYNVSARPRWQVHKYVGNGLCWSEKFRTCLTREESQKAAELSVSWEKF